MGHYDEYKRRVLRITQRLSADGYFGSKSGSAGNVSMLVEDEDAVVVTPTRLRYDVMTVEDICVVGFDLARIEGERKPSIETPMHVATYKVRADVSAVIHTHQTFASALSVLNQPIPPLFDEVTLAIGNTIDVVPYALSGSRELHDNVARKLANRCHCYIIQNHGALCIGTDLDKTFTFVELLEKSATIYMRALATGKPVTVLPAKIVAQLHSEMIARQDREIARKQERHIARIKAVPEAEPSH
ncbi:class II aldolase/adducin family protein [Candidatus Binatus sp.]|jgi:L-fuculose-phosphate aldolase|uniref:class II aldolase/adducin family protein n=1 Tax=Candidatus Binatus sp. TaxID=2811406 RepID=UPI002FD9A5AF